MSFEIIATVANSTHAASFMAWGATMLRLNGAHLTPASCATMVAVCRQAGPVLLDLPGRKLRTRLSQPLFLETGQPVRLTPENITPREGWTVLQHTPQLIACEGRVPCTIQTITDTDMSLMPHGTGTLATNKSLHLPGCSLAALPMLSAHDYALLEVSHGVTALGLSYLHTAGDVRAVRAIVGKTVQLYGKIETREAVQNLPDILREVDAVIIDRGDLSSECGLRAFPHIEQAIITQAQAASVPVIVATHVVLSMLHTPYPSLTECVQLAALHRCVNGIQLSEETAIGPYPHEVLQWCQQ